MGPSLVVVLLSVAPLQVRVLEREHLATARVSGAVSCSGTPVPSPVEVSVGVRELRVGATTCGEVLVTEATVTAGELTRSYPGTLRISLDGATLRLVDEVDVEAYLPSVVQAEAGGQKPAALEAQSVVSRTFALASRRRHRDYDLCDLAHCQVYRGVGGDEPSRSAVAKTKGQVLLSGSVALKPVYFHASCGGHTSSAHDVFGEDSGGPGVADAEAGVVRCHDSADFAWSFVVERAKASDALGGRDDGPVVEVLRRDDGGRVIELKLFGRRMTGSDFLSRAGRAFGWQALRSAKFQVEEVEGLVRFTGAGRGHGVGLCQAGAQSLAQQGVDAKGILARYFPDARLADVAGFTR
jgi:stage II sporulation protein D